MQIFIFCLAMSGILHHRCHKQEFLLKFVKDMGRTEIQQLRRHWIEEALHHNNLERHSCWSESLAVGNEGFGGKVNLALELQGRKRAILESPEGYVLREAKSSYGILA